MSEEIVLTEAQQQAQAALDKVMNCRFSNFDAGAVVHWAERGMYQVKTERESFQDRLAGLHSRLFDGDPTDIRERVARFFEEAGETAQAFGMSEEEAIKLVRYSWRRPAGEPTKEVGAAFVTLVSLCIVAGLDAMACAEADLEKLSRPESIERIRAKRATRHGRGPLPGFDPPGKVGIVPRDKYHHAYLDSTHRKHPDGSYFK